jgi:cell division protein FtsL
MANKKTDFEKIGVYIAAIMAFLTIIFYIIEIKVDVSALKVKVDYLEKATTHGLAKAVSETS